MKTLQDIKKEFLRQAQEYDSGKKEEDFHAYLRHHKLDHYLSETQRQNRQMESNYLNGIGMTMAIGVPLTLGAIFGRQKLTSALLGHSEYHQIGDSRSLDEYLNMPIEKTIVVQDALSGINTRTEPAPALHASQYTTDHIGDKASRVLSSLKAFQKDFPPSETGNPPNLGETRQRFVSNTYQGLFPMPDGMSREDTLLTPLN